MDDISIMPLDRARQAYPKHGIYYSSIFTPLRVIHLRDTITGSDLILKSCLSGHFIFVSDHIKLCPDPLQMEQSGNSDTVTAIISASADYQDPFVLLEILFCFLYHLQCCPLHQNLGGNSDLTDRCGIQILHFFAGNKLLHSVFCLPSVIEKAAVSGSLTILTYPHVPACIC